MRVRERVLTYGHAPLARVSGESVRAAATVEAPEVPAAAARAHEEAQRPALAIVAPVVRVLRAVCTRIRAHVHALPAPRARAARVTLLTGRGRAALRALEALRRHARARELSVNEPQHEHEHSSA